MMMHEKIKELLFKWGDDRTDIDTLINNIIDTCNKNTNHIKEQIKQEIENNSYYKNIRKDYLESEDKDHIGRIYNIYLNWYNAEYSIYKIMDTIEDYMAKNGDSFEDVVNYEDFELKD